MNRRYFVSRDPDGTVSHLVRICETDTALWGEYYREGRWTEDASVMAYLGDGALGERVSEAEALAIADDAQAGSPGSASTGRLAPEEVDLLEILIESEEKRQSISGSATQPVARPGKYVFAIGLDDAGKPFRVPAGRDTSRDC